MRLIACLFILLSLSGCAIQTTSDGKLHVELDEAALLGEQVATIRLANGGTAAIRKLGQDYSLKLDQYQKVVPLGAALGARLLSVEHVNKRTLLVFEKIETNCPLKTQLIEIDGANLAGWDIGNCQSSASIANDRQGSVILDFQNGGAGLRYLYWEGELRKLGLDGQRVGPPSALAESAVTGMARYVPPLPQPFRDGAGKLASASTHNIPTRNTSTSAELRPVPPTRPPSPPPSQQKATLVLKLDQ